MGSCRGLNTDSEQLNEADVENYPCSMFAENPLSDSEAGHQLIDSNVDNFNDQCGCPEFSLVDDKDELKGEQEIGVLGLENLVDKGCGVSLGGDYCEPIISEVKTAGLFCEGEEYLSIICEEQGLHEDLKDIGCCFSGLELSENMEQNIDTEDELYGDMNANSLLPQMVSEAPEEKNNFLDRLHTDSHQQVLPSEISGRSSEYTNLACLQKNCVERNDKVTRDLSVEGDAVDKTDDFAMIEANTSNTMLPAVASEVSPEFVSETHSLNFLVQQIELKEPNNPLDVNASNSTAVEAYPCKETVSSHAGEMTPEVINMCDITKETCGQSLPVEEDISSLNVHSWLSAGEYIPGVYSKEAVGEHNVEFNCDSKTHNSQTMLTSSQRSNQGTSQKTQTIKIVRNCRKAEKKQLQKELEFASLATRMKRSCVSKPARSSAWGLSESITNLFSKGDNVSNQIQDQQAKKLQSQSTADQTIGSPGGSSKNQASTSRIRLKVKFGKEVSKSTLNIPEAKLVDDSSSVNIHSSDYKTGLLGSSQLANVVEDKLWNEETKTQIQLQKNQEKVLTDLEKNSFVNMMIPKDKGTECIAASGKPGGGDADTGLSLSSNGVARDTDKMYMDPGTSPDSVLDAQADDLHNAVVSAPKAPVARKYITEKKGQKKEKLFCTEISCLEDRLLGTVSLKNPKQMKNCGGSGKKDKCCYSSDVVSSSLAKSPSNMSSSLKLSVEPLTLPGQTTLENSEALELEVKSCCSPGVDVQSAESLSSKDYSPNKLKGLSSLKPKGRKSLKSSKSNRGKKLSLESSDSVKSKKGNTSKQRISQSKSGNKNKAKKASDQAMDMVKHQPEKDYQVVEDKAKSDNAGATVTDATVANATVADATVADATVADAAYQGMIPDGVSIQNILEDSAWVRCDDCQKWRRIPAALVDSLGGNCRWICMYNSDKAFSDCSIAQEMSSEDINAELGISDTEVDAREQSNFKELDQGFKCRRLPGSQKACFQGIKINRFLHRTRKAQTIDEIMVCQCKPPRDGKLGCGDECLNRMLNIECVQGTCPSGDRCSNQQFQQRKYVKFEKFKSGKKGYGLKVLEDVKEGQFLIEYVGEVLDLQAYGARQKEYAANGQKHFYFMTLNGSEVIDAGAKGNLGRFINHSCDPNCRTEKWVVNGEICIGIFALREIKKEEEVTFDYNYVRVVGAAVKKCRCGSPQCQGYIGGDPLSSEVIQSDSDDEYPEPVMVEVDETGDGIERETHGASLFDGTKVQIKDSVEHKMQIDGTPLQHVEITTEVESSTPDIPQLKCLMEMENLEEKLIPTQPEYSVVTMDVTSPPTVTAQQDIIVEGENKKISMYSQTSMMATSPSTIVTKSSSDSIDASKKSKPATGQDKQTLPSSRPLVKTSRSSGSMKKGKFTSNATDVKKGQIIVPNKSQAPFFKIKRPIDDSSGPVEVKLNDLLDDEGGISKRKDATKGYLKLLLLTAASRGSACGESIQSNRDLSMILDAILKSKSRSILIDIINKNGLQMLHNMIKQYRSDFKKIPILRKLLKVLEYLAEKDILTREHITEGPPCRGMESFSASILSLTEHDNKQVHQIARNFRDRWIPRSFRRHAYMNRDESRMESQRDSISSRFSGMNDRPHGHRVRPTEATASVPKAEVVSINAIHEHSSEPCTTVAGIDGSKMRKRSSRWDQPTWNLNPCSVSNKQQKVDSRSPQQLEARTGDAVHDLASKEGSSDSHNGNDEHVGMNIDEDVPPGFSLPHQLSVSSNTHPNVVVAQPQAKFLSCLPVTYGIPLTVIQKSGSDYEEAASNSWIIAPGMPFHPFPPLPAFPRGRKHPRRLDEHNGERKQPASCNLEENRPSTTDAKGVVMDICHVDTTEAPSKKPRGSV